MSKIRNSIKLLQLEDKLYDLAFSLRLSRSKKDIKSDYIAEQLSETKDELEKLGWKSEENFENKFQSDLRPEDYIGMI